MDVVQKRKKRYGMVGRKREKEREKEEKNTEKIWLLELTFQKNITCFF